MVKDVIILIILKIKKICLLYENDNVKKINKVTTPLKDPSINYTKVSDGIHLVAYYKNIKNKQILLLGEVHIELTKCDSSLSSSSSSSSLLEWCKTWIWKIL